MSELKEFTLDQIKLWKLSNSQLKMQIEVELKRAEKLQQSLKEAELLLSKTKEAAIPFYQAQVQTYQAMIKAGAAPQSDESLISALVSLRRQNVQLQTRIEQTKKQTEELQTALNKSTGSDAHAKYARVMEALKSQAADIRVTYSSDDVLEMDDIVMEEGVSYKEAKERVDQKRESWKTGEAPPADL